MSISELWDMYTSGFLVVRGLSGYGLHVSALIPKAMRRALRRCREGREDF